jgi:hypothetical protein
MLYGSGWIFTPTLDRGTLSLPYFVALQALKPKSSLRKKTGWMQAPHWDRMERSGEVFLLDILSHRVVVCDDSIHDQIPSH